MADVISENPITSVDQTKGSETHSEDSATEKKVIYDREHEQGRLKISETLDKLNAYMSLVRSSAEKQFTTEDIVSILKDIGIVKGIREDEIKAALSLLIEKNYTTTDLLLIAEGHRPINERDGEIEILYNQKNPYVEKGQSLLRIKDPFGGKAGEDIYGNPVEPTPGKIPHVVVGSNVVVEETNKEFISNIFGKVTFINNTLAVDKALDITLSPDRMQTSVSYNGVTDLTMERIKEELFGRGITFGIDEDRINTLVITFNTGREPIKKFVVAQGKQPQKGRDGNITFSFETGEGPRYKEQEDGSIDIRETNIIQNVKTGEEIAVITPHIESVPGKDVFGRKIPVAQVKKVTLRPGKNVTVSEDGLHFFAEASGRPILEDDKLSVSEVFLVSGDLNLAVGNIDFDGIVEITGDVEDGFKVKASKTIIIGGLVGACDIEAGLDIQINGGCNGKEQAHLQCSGNLEARYLNEAQVTARGDVIIKNEVVNSDIRCLGRVSVNSGSVRGGRIAAKKGIESFDIGSDIGVKTRLIPGDDYELNQKCSEIEAVIIEKNKEMEQINKTIAPLLKNKELLPKLPEEQRNKIIETINYLKQLQEEKDSLNNTKNELITESLKDAVPEAVVHHYIYHGVILKVGDSRREIASKLEGPLRLYEENERVTVEPYSEKRPLRQARSAV